MRRLVFYSTLLGLLTLGVWPGTAASPVFHITIESAATYYHPASATVTTGATIRWENPTPAFHTVTHDGCLTTAGPCAFDSGAVAPNSSYSVPSLPPGRYPYHCQVHPIMRAVLVVTDPQAIPSPT